MSSGGTTPHIRDDHAQLQDIIEAVLRRFGDFAVSAIDGDTVSLMLDLANVIVEEVNNHPYWPHEPVEYYHHVTEARAIPDLIMKAGLLFQYATQQASPKMELYARAYYQTMNTLLWRRLNNNAGSQPIRARVVDGGSNKSKSPQTDYRTGQPLKSNDHK